MKKPLLTASAACLALASLSLPAAADLPVTLKFGAGYWFFDHELFGFEVEDEATPVVGAEWAFDDNWSAEILFAHTDTDLRHGPEADVTTWQLGVLRFGDSLTGDGHNVRPYAALGAGQIDLDAGSFDNVETTMNGGAGVRWMISDRVGVHLEGRAVYSFDEDDTDFLTTAGISFYLGDVDSGAAAVAAVAGAGATGGDADGDGVADDRDRCPDTAAGTRVDADGCPLSVAQVASVKLKVNFAFDSSVVQDRYFSDLSELATFLQRFSDLQVEVEGHTDSIGPEAYNQGLSQRRAQAVVDYLVSQHGISASRLQPKGYGESQPVAGNDTEEGRAENRRVMATLEVEYEE